MLKGQHASVQVAGVLVGEHMFGQGQGVDLHPRVGCVMWKVRDSSVCHDNTGSNTLLGCSFFCFAQFVNAFGIVRF